MRVAISSTLFVFHRSCFDSVCISQECFDRITDRVIVADEKDGYQVYCCLCGEGGEVVLCDICDSVGCIECISRVCGQQFCDMLVSDEDQPWLCFICNPAPLHCQMRIRKRLITAIRLRSKEGKQGEKKSKRRSLEDDSTETILVTPQKRTRRRLSSDSSSSSFTID